METGRGIWVGGGSSKLGGGFLMEAHIKSVMKEQELVQAQEGQPRACQAGAGTRGNVQ